MNELQLIERFRTTVEAPDPDRIVAARARLEAEYGSHTLPRVRVTRRWVLTAGPVAALGALLAMVAALVVAGAPGGRGPAVADAAIIRHAGAALTAPPNEILHTKVQGDGFASETWQLTSAPYSFLAYKGPIGAAVPEESADATTASWYDPATNTIHQSRMTKSPGGFHDLLTQVHQALQSGEARVLGTAQVDGVNTYKIQFAEKGQYGTDSLVAYVDQSTYRPILLDDPQRDGSVVHLRVLTIQFLAATPANLQLLNLAARHPHSHVISAGASASGTLTQK